MKRWYYFLVQDYGSDTSRWTGPEYVNDEEMLSLITHTKANHLGMSVYPFVYSSILGYWIWDPRNDREILAGAPIPGYVA